MQLKELNIESMSIADILGTILSNTESSWAYISTGSDDALARKRRQTMRCDIASRPKTFDLQFREILFDCNSHD